MIPNTFGFESYIPINYNFCLTGLSQYFVIDRISCITHFFALTRIAVFLQLLLLAPCAVYIGAKVAPFARVDGAQA